MTPYDHIPAQAETPAYNKTSPQHYASGAYKDDQDRVRLLKRIVSGVAIALVILLGAGIVQHYLNHRAAVAAMEARQNTVPKVRVEQAKLTTNPRALSLPGTTNAFESATIYARQSGYIAQRMVDIGSKVKQGDLLAVIASPEIDDQLTQARAQLVQMEASLRQAGATKALAQATDKRTAVLVEQGWQSRQQGDTDRLNLQAQAAAVGVAEANLQAQRAQVARLEKEQSYERVIAPFDGVITQRSIDTGSLVTADNASGSSMFALARTNVLRVQVYVPQDAAFGLKEGVIANVHVPEIPDRVFTGHVARTAEALQAGTRTLLTEIDIDNPDEALAAGVYCTVDFKVPRPNPVIVVPAEALIINRDGVQVAVYEDGKARLRKVTLAEDNGENVDIAAGLKEGDQVIVNLPVDLTDGSPVALR